MHSVLLRLQYWPIIARFNNDDLFLNQVQTTQYGLRSLSFSGAKLWNSLPLDVKQITPFSRFQQNVKNSMIDRYNKDTDN